MNDRDLVYLSSTLTSVPRALALIDQRPTLKTSGSFDRSFWHYKTLSNFSSSVWQQLGLALSSLWNFQHPTNPHFRDPLLYEAASRGLLFWTTIQHADGSFDEWYVNEHSYCPTAFTTMGMALTYLELSSPGMVQGDAQIRAALLRAGRWLESRCNPVVMNQNLAAGTALLALYEITTDPKWLQAARQKFEFVRARQTVEGWLPEYEGCDLGYSTLSLDLVALADERLRRIHSQPNAQRNSPLVSSLGPGALSQVLGELSKGLIEFLRHVSVAFGPLPGRLGSRGTAHVFPLGMEYFSRTSELAKECCVLWRRWHHQNLVANPSSVDDRYFAYFYLPQFALACTRYNFDLDHPRDSRVTSVNAKPHGRGTDLDRVVNFPEAGLHIRTKGDSSLALSLKMGGGLAVRQGNQRCAYFLGYRLVTGDGTHYVSGSQDFRPPATASDRSFVLEHVPFRRVKTEPPLEKLMIPFQVFLLFLRSSVTAGWFQNNIKKAMISAQGDPIATLTRRVSLEINPTQISELRIFDTITLEAKRRRIVSVEPMFDISMHSPSAKQDIARPLYDPHTKMDDIAKRLSEEGEVQLEFVCDLLSEAQAAPCRAPSTRASADVFGPR